MKVLRGWQAEALPAIFKHIDERPLVRAVMGAGKSVLIAELVKHAPDTLNVVITTPSVRLVDDLADVLLDWAGIEAGRWYTHAKEARRVTVCCNNSLQSLVDSGELPGPVEIWIADEAHKTECAQIKDALKGLNPYRRVGFSATPWRAEEGARLTEFETLAYDYTAARAIQDGVVVAPRVQHYKGTATDLNTACAEAIEYAVAQQLGPGLANAGNIEDAEEFVKILSKRGIRAKAIHSGIGRDLENARIEALKNGELHCLVHVDMLAEGVNLPWLRWLCCRRPVGSKVRFAQEVGRVLRAYPGKDHAVVFDPHNLFSVFALDDKAVLNAGGDIEGEDPVRLPALQLDFLCMQIKKDPEPPETYRGVPVALLDPVASYLVKLNLQFQFAGIIDPEIKSKHWRSEPPSEKQIALAEKMGKRVIARTDDMPNEHQTALKVSIAASPGLKKGPVSDLIGILMAVDKRRIWPDYITVEVAL